MQTLNRDTALGFLPWQLSFTIFMRCTWTHHDISFAVRGDIDFRQNTIKHSVSILHLAVKIDLNWLILLDFQFDMKIVTPPAVVVINRCLVLWKRGSRSLLAWSLHTDTHNNTHTRSERSTPPGYKNDADHPVNYKAFLPSGLGSWHAINHTCSLLPPCYRSV